MDIMCNNVMYVNTHCGMCNNVMYVNTHCGNNSAFVL